MKRGDLVTVSLPGDYGKPRPALIIQSDLFGMHPSVVVLPITSELQNAPLFRIRLMPDSQNGLNKPSQVMVDKPYTIARTKVSAAFGNLDDGALIEVERSLALFLGIAK
ncbi:MAG: type II toxin-antitoxin system PemK/MazF family toxin [Halothiobacillaceae bacterium]|nr:MAG: type II toxin-antitoxin system PemK/MazF family toxin [Halothiobacillaceae bacterium]